MPMSELERIRVGVGAFIQDREGRVLLEKRRDCGLWCLPGGMLESRELVTETAIREVEEETGLKVKVTGFVGIYSDPKNRMITFPDTGTFRLIDIVVRANILGGILRVSPESFELGFFAENQLPALLNRAMEPISDAFKGVVGGLS